MENNNGRGIFYGVIGVATLVVAIIGATFAYFSASAVRNNAVNVSSTEITLDIINEVSNFKTDMIPVETIENKTLDHDNTADTDAITVFSTFPGLTATGEGAGTCVDLVGNSICSVYQFTIENPSATTAQTVVGSLKVTANTGFENLTYAVFKGAASQITHYDVNAAAQATTVISGTTQVDAAFGTVVVGRTKIGAAETVYDWDNTVERLDPGETTTYTIVVWLEEADEAQDDEQKQTFAASIEFTSDNGGGVTGVLTATS